jgi:hypothetical protein
MSYFKPGGVQGKLLPALELDCAFVTAPGLSRFDPTLFQPLVSHKCVSGLKVKLLSICWLALAQ